MNPFVLLDMLKTPVWIIRPSTEEVLHANPAAIALDAGLSIDDMRHGSLSACVHPALADYTPAILAREQVVEIWTIQQQGQQQPLCCHLRWLEMAGQADAILIEASPPSHTMPAPQASATTDALAEDGFHRMLMQTNSAPMLLIDPDDEGRIVNVNEAAMRFYGYSRAEFAAKHTWEINAQGRAILPVMQQISLLPGGHKPLSFVHRLADGSLRDVQTYAGPVEVHGKRLMLCVIHDITEQQRLKAELEQAALRDPLTGLWNRRYLLQQLERAILEKQRFGNGFSLILLDADHFKRINDQFGHFTGDEVLVWLAHSLQSRVRAVDSVCRWGGEEFIILLPQTSQHNALHLAECLRETVASSQKTHLPAITISMGVTQHLDEESLESLIMRVDHALYQAKTLGRNCVIAA